jgi:alpha-glucosidase
MVLHGVEYEPKIRLGEKWRLLKKKFVSLMDPVSRFDPQGAPNPKEVYSVQSLVVNK